VAAVSPTQIGIPPANVADGRPMTAATNRIGQVDGLRAIAMTMVIAQHCKLLPFGWTGVWLFFVISGYVITRGFVSGSYAGATPGRTYGVFLFRRAIRIIPVYVLYVCLNAGILVAFYGPSRLGDFPYLATFTYNWQAIYDFWPGSSNWSPIGHLWTLSVEQQFYLVFPVLVLALPPGRQMSALVGGIIAGPIVRLAASYLAASASGDDGWRAFSIYANTACQFDAFLMGALIARLSPDDLRCYAARRKYFCLGILGLSLLYVSGYVLINWQNGARGVDVIRCIFSGILYGQQREVFVYCVVDLVAALLLVEVLADGRRFAFLRGQFITWVGRVSYGGYLFHALVAAAAWNLLDIPSKSASIGSRLVLLAVVFAVTVGIASMSFRWFEVPVAARLRRLGDRVGTGGQRAPDPLGVVSANARVSD